MCLSLACGLAILVPLDPVYGILYTDTFLMFYVTVWLFLLCQHFLVTNSCSISYMEQMFFLSFNFGPMFKLVHHFTWQMLVDTGAKSLATHLVDFSAHRAICLQ